MSVNKIIVIFGIILVLFVAIVLFQFSGMGKQNSPAFKTKANVTINNQKFKVAVATTPQEQEQGLSGVPKLNDDQGMIFLFDKSAEQAFWMKGMKFPLDLIYIQNDKIVTIVKNAPTPEPGVVSPVTYIPSAPVNKVLEINAGLADKYQFKEGDTVKVDL
jgi:uncharacterized membrane protein (UPF0127 family)